MRYFLVIFFLILSFNSYAEEKFLNPIFYQEMKTYGRLPYTQKVTPTSVTSKDFIEQSACVLIENNPTDIILLCRDSCERSLALYSRYINAGDVDFIESGGKEHSKVCTIYERTGELEDIKNDRGSYQPFETLPLNGEEGNCGEADEGYTYRLRNSIRNSSYY